MSSNSPRKHRAREANTSVSTPRSRATRPPSSRGAVPSVLTYRRTVDRPHIHLVRQRFHPNGVTKCDSHLELGHTRNRACQRAADHSYDILMRFAGTGVLKLQDVYLCERCAGKLKEFAEHVPANVPAPHGTRATGGRGVRNRGAR